MLRLTELGTGSTLEGCAGKARTAPGQRSCLVKRMLSLGRPGRRRPSCCRSGTTAAGAAQCQAGVRDGGSCRSAERGLACNDLVLLKYAHSQPPASQHTRFAAIRPSGRRQPPGVHQPSVSSSTCSAFSALGRCRASGDRQAAISSTMT